MPSTHTKAGGISERQRGGYSTTMATAGSACDWVQRLKKLDDRGSITWTSYQSLDEPPLGISWEDLDRAAYLVSDTDEVSEGFYAIRGLLTRLPSLAVLGMFMHLPGVGLIGRPLYRLVARNRKRVLSCGAR